MNNLGIVFVVIVLQIAWTVVVRVFPRILTTALTKSIEHQYATALSKVKADLDARYRTLTTSVEFLAASQSEVTSKRILAIQSIWIAVTRIEREFGDLVMWDNLLYQQEKEKLFSSDRMKQHLGDYCDTDLFTNKLKRLNEELTPEKDRLLSGEQLWLRFSTISRAYGRMCWLANQSFEEKRYVDWKTDEFMTSILKPVIPIDILGNIKKNHRGGFREITSRLRAEFLREANRVMSGSQQVADSLSDLQATLMSEQQRLSADQFTAEEQDRPTDSPR